MIGRRVRTFWGEQGKVVEWEPLGEAMCDALVEQDNGQKVWYASSNLHPLDGCPLPSRREARRLADVQALAQLRAIRVKHVEQLHIPWPGAEFGKALVGKAIDGAISKLEGKDDNEHG
jgi:hypothetical protein